MSHLFTSESVSEGHPDKVCDLIADSILDAYLAQDPNSQVACEVLCKNAQVVLAGEIQSRANVNHASVARKAIRRIGYCDPDEKFNAEGVRIRDFLECLPEHFRDEVDHRDSRLRSADQGLVFGFATTETPELLPLPITLAHQITRTLAHHRHTGTVSFLRPDAKSQVTVRYEGANPVEVVDVVVSTQHAKSTHQSEVKSYVRETLLPQALGTWFNPSARLWVNPSGPFDVGGPEGDCGVTGRKIVVDTYGGAAPHGGGAFSGKDATKVDRSAAYFARYVARKIVQRRLAQIVEIQVAYAIGVSEPISIRVDTKGTGDNAAAAQYAARFDFRPGSIIRDLNLDQPIYTQTTNYGHFGKPSLEWEK
jgi:S-adenosylmethionine synthetase